MHVTNVVWMNGWLVGWLVGDDRAADDRAEGGKGRSPGSRTPAPPRGRGSPGAAAKSSPLFASASHRASPGAALSAHDSRSTDVLDKSRG